MLHTTNTEWQPIDDEPEWLPSKVNNHNSLRRISLNRSTSTKLQTHSKKYELNARSNLAIIGAGNPHWIAAPLSGHAQTLRRSARWVTTNSSWIEVRKTKSTYRSSKRCNQPPTAPSSAENSCRWQPAPRRWLPVVRNQVVALLVPSIRVGLANGFESEPSESGDVGRSCSNSFLCRRRSSRQPIATSQEPWRSPSQRPAYPPASQGIRTSGVNQ